MRTDAQLLLLDRDAIASLLTSELACQAVHDAFALHGTAAGRGFPVVREPLAHGVFGIKSGEVEERRLLGFKAAGFWPANRAHGGEPHQATVMLFDPATGRPLCLMDGNAITTARTAAAGELGLRTLARPDSGALCVFGTGVRARAQLAAALRALPGLHTLRYVTHDGQRNPAFEAHFVGHPLQWAPDANTAVAHSDIIITATPGSGALFDAAAVRAGTHINCVGADTRGKRELPADLLERADVTVVVDDRVQALTLGELQWARGTPCVELGDVLTGAATFARSPATISVFDMTGLALQDLVLGEYLYGAAQAQGQGRLVSWPW